jgi:hypothetical protein
MVLNATRNNISVISWRLDLLVEGTRVSRENQRPDKLYHIKLYRVNLSILTSLVVIGTDYTMPSPSPQHKQTILRQVKRWATKNPKSNMRLAQMLVNDKQFRFLRRETMCYSPSNVGDKDKKNSLRKREKDPFLFEKITTVEYS